MSRFLGGFISGVEASTIKRRQVSGVHRVLQLAQLLDAQGLHVKGWENHYLKIKYDMGFEPPNASGRCSLSVRSFPIAGSLGEQRHLTPL